MALDHSLVGVASDPVERGWDADDVILYALGVGAGSPDPTEELAFTTENTMPVSVTARLRTSWNRLRTASLGAIQTVLSGPAAPLSVTAISAYQDGSSSGR